MSISVACTKGCGVPISVSDEELADFQRLGKTIDVAHEVCPRDRVTQPLYKVRVSVVKYEDGDENGDGVQLATAGGKVHGESLEKAIPEITKQLNSSWEQVRQMAALAEQ